MTNAVSATYVRYPASNLLHKKGFRLGYDDPTDALCHYCDAQQQPSRRREWREELEERTDTVIVMDCDRRSRLGVNEMIPSLRRDVPTL